MTAVTVTANTPAVRGRTPVAPDRRTAPASAGPVGARRMRITVRGRLVLSAIALGLLLALGAGRAVAGGAQIDDRTTTVESGQTLSQIALRELPGLPLDEAVVAIQVENKLSTPHVHAGQVLVIPAR